MTGRNVVQAIHQPTEIHMSKHIRYALSCLFLWMFSAVALASDGNDCLKHDLPDISFIQFPSLDLTRKPPTPLTIKGKLTIPKPCAWESKNSNPNQKWPAVLILHGSAGVDARGDFYAQALNAAGIATLEIDMWEARGVVGAQNRPPLPFFNYPDAFGALAFLAQHPEIDPHRIGELGFSWGAVVTLASATTLYSEQFGGTGPEAPRFAAHVANYPVCWAYNAVYPPVTGSPIPGTAFGTRSSGISAPLTGAPILIQVGTQDSYDDGPEPCLALKNSLIPVEQAIVDITVYEAAYHGWDRLQVPISGIDPFSHLGAGGMIDIRPDVPQAYESQRNVVAFFRDHL